MFIKFLRFRAVREQLRAMILEILVDQKITRPSFMKEDLETVLEILPNLFGYVLHGKGFHEMMERKATNEEALNIAGGLVQMFYWIGLHRNNVLKKELAADDMVWAEIAACAVKYRTMPSVVPKEFLDMQIEEFRDGFKKHLSDTLPTEKAEGFAKIFDSLLPGACEVFDGRQGMFTISPFRLL
jgi:hypothetical protein